MQVKFLRVLQEGEVVHVGATRPIPIDVRIIAATHPKPVGRYPGPDISGRICSTAWLWPF